CFSMESNSRCAGVISAYFRNCCSTEFDLCLAARLLDAGSGADVIDADTDKPDMHILLRGGAASAMPFVTPKRRNCFRTLLTQPKTMPGSLVPCGTKLPGKISANGAARALNPCCSRRTRGQFCGRGGRHR